MSSNGIQNYLSVLVEKYTPADSDYTIEVEVDGSSSTGQLSISHKEGSLYSTSNAQDPSALCSVNVKPNANRIAGSFTCTNLSGYFKDKSGALSEIKLGYTATGTFDCLLQ
jgi:hypothetical protein